MSINIKLQGAKITFEQEDVMIGGSTLALLADIEGVVSIEPGKFAQVPTPITFTGDGKTIALIEMHAGRLSHALGAFENEAPAHGEYFLPKVGVDTAVFVDVLNETGATILIRPGMRIGIMTLINIGSNEASAAGTDQDPVSAGHIRISADYAPKFLNPENVPAEAPTNSSGVTLRADLANDVVIYPGTTLLVPTGFSAAIPKGFDGQVRAGADIPHGAFVSQNRDPDDNFVSVLISNASNEPITIKQGAQVADFVFVPVAIAVLSFNP